MCQEAQAQLPTLFGINSDKALVLAADDSTISTHEVMAIDVEEWETPTAFHTCQHTRTRRKNLTRRTEPSSRSRRHCATSGM